MLQAAIQACDKQAVCQRACKSSLTATSVPVPRPPWSGLRSGWLLSGPLAAATRGGAVRSSSRESGSISRSRRVRSVPGAAGGVGGAFGGELEEVMTGCDGCCPSLIGVREQAVQGSRGSRRAAEGSCCRKTVAWARPALHCAQFAQRRTGSSTERCRSTDRPRSRVPGLAANAGLNKLGRSRGELEVAE